MSKKIMMVAGIMWGLLAFVGPYTASADIIYVSGDVTGVWSADTVIVTADVRIPTGSALFIQPGVEIYFWGYYKMIVDNYATLMAVGSVSDSIYFDESWLWPNNGWHGIRFLSASSSSRLEYCHLTNGYAWGSGGDEHGGAIYCNNSNPSIQNCLIDSCEATWSGGAIYCDSNSDPTISQNTIRGNTCWDYGGGIYLGSYSTASINNNQIIGNTAWDFGGGIYCGSFSEPEIAGNSIMDNSGLDYAGGIYCGSNSTPDISENTITGNFAPEFGGGIYCGTMSNPAITNNNISGNGASSGGGIYCASSSNPELSDNTLNANDANLGGGIFCGTYSFADIYSNVIEGNTAVDGGGIYCTNLSTPSIIENVITGNGAVDGGGLFLDSSNSTLIDLNEISLNIASDSGGGIYLIYSSPTLNKNTIAGDTAAIGGGIYSVSSNPTLVNCIVWGNLPQEIHPLSGSNVQATYSDIGFTTVWPGIGNINDDPMFVSASIGDFQLLEDSPCIDTGHPNAIYNDPDGTRADMGCYFYDQGDSNLIDLQLTYVSGSPIPPTGGNLVFDIYLENISSNPLDFDAWIDITYEGGSPNTVISRSFSNFLPGWAVDRTGMFFPIPGSYAPGNYTFTAKTGVHPDEVWVQDGFPFVKSGNSDGIVFQPHPVSGAPNPFGEGDVGDLKIASDFGIISGYPNPFNPTTSISFALPHADMVSLTVYDLLGRQVAILVDGYRKAGTHEVTFDGSELASGVYVCRIQAGENSSSLKIVLKK
jgi:parallel beta-helix repeat protein/predicted outer membrane repeat protein